jgi:hypothetical protein
MNPGSQSAAVLEQRPDLTLVKLADGAKDNWSYFGTALPQGPEIIDFYHACDHLKSAFDAAYGENSSRSKAQFEKYRHLLRDEEEGVEKVIRALCHLRDAHPRKKKLSTELAYFRRYRHRMRYAKARAQNLPIGSGVVSRLQNARDRTDEALGDALAPYRGPSHLDAARPPPKRALRAWLEVVVQHLQAHRRDPRKRRAVPQTNRALRPHYQSYAHGVATAPHAVPTPWAFVSNHTADQAYVCRVTVLHATNLRVLLKVRAIG